MFDAFRFEPEQVDVEGYVFQEWSYSERCAVEDEAALQFNRFTKYSQWENEVIKTLFVRHCVSWPCSKWPQPIPCTDEAKQALYAVQTELCRKLVMRARTRIQGLQEDRVKNLQTGQRSGELTQ